MFNSIESYLTYNSPAAIRLTARRSMRLLFFAADNDRLLKFSAVLTAVCLESTRRCNATMVAAVGITP